MTYESTAIIAFIVLAIIDQDVLWRASKDVQPARKAYRNFLFAILAYYVTDALWGILDGKHFVRAIYIDTTVYFVAMGAVVMLWTKYVVTYLEKEDLAGTVLLTFGKLFLAAGIACVVLNFFQPILFWFDESGEYHAGFARNTYLGIQIVMFLFTSIYTFWATLKVERTMRTRYLAIGFFGVAMTVFIAVQFSYPLLPLYALGCMVGSCVLHTFVVEGEKEEHRRALEETLERERERERELGSARKLAFTDPLTGVKSRHAYIEAEAQLNQRIAEGHVKEFGIAVFDLNELKVVNDSKGHEEGDRLIIAACKMICNQFKHSPIFRVGGDEFVALLENTDYRNRADLLASFNQLVDLNLHTGGPVIAAGIADFDPRRDSGCWTVFDRADVEMYRRKSDLKATLA